MKNFLILLFLIIFNVFSSKSQNIVPNPSFEDTLNCPTAINQLAQCSNWWPSRASPDYFNSCNFISGTAGVPHNYYGLQNANTGNAYVGFIPFSRNAPNGREYFTCQLITPMVIGLNYNISYYLNMAAGAGMKIACNKIGIYFSTINFNLSSPLPLQNFAHVYSDSVLKDSINWVLFNFNFVADSNYTHLSFGNFFNDAVTDTISIDQSALSYYYLDDISVVPDTISSLEHTVSFPYITYPNPFIEYVFLEDEMLTIRKIEIRNYLGQLVYKKAQFNSRKIELNLADLNCGFYTMIILNNKNENIYSKIIKN